MRAYLQHVHVRSIVSGRNTIHSVCARMSLVRKEFRVCIFYLYISVYTNRVNDNFLQSGSKNLLNWQFKRYIYMYTH